MGASGAFSAVLNDLTNLPQAVTDAQAARDAAEAAQTAAEAAAAAAAASMPGAANGTAQLDASSKLLEAQVPDRLTEDGLLATYAGVAALAAPGIDRTGAIDCTDALQGLLSAVPENAIAYLPEGDYKISKLIHDVPGVVLTGPGRLLSTIVNDAGISVRGQGASVMSLTLIHETQQSLTKSAQTGAQQHGILIEANDVLVERCLIDSWQHGVTVSAFGEFYGARIHHNRIKDIVGAGDGPSTDPNAYGEDRGDGITVWGAGASIVGNVVNAKAGTDARIGIHTEALDVYEVTPGVHPDRLVTIAGNVVYGQFRRGIVTEGVHGAAITGNTVADSTWWAIGIARADNCTVTGNTVLWTRTSADDQGSAWSPYRGPLSFYGACRGSLIAHNTVRFAPTSDAKAMLIAQSAGGTDVATDCDFDSNIGYSETGAVVGSLAFMDNAIRCRIRDNKHTGQALTDHGVFFFSATDPEVVGNDFVGSGSGSGFDGVHIEGGAATVTRIMRNTVRSFLNGILLSNNTGGALVCQNFVRDCGNGVDLFGTTGALVSGNIWKGVTTPIVNVGANTQADNLSVAA